MIKKIPVLLAMAPVVLLAGCASTNGMNGYYHPWWTTSNTYIAYGNSNNKAVAKKVAMKKAAGYCQNMGKNVVIVKTGYQGMDNNTSMSMHGTMSATASVPPTSSKYQAIVKFQCK